jgi:hypothetical protein
MPNGAVSMGEDAKRTMMTTVDEGSTKKPCVQKKVKPLDAGGIMHVEVKRTLKAVGLFNGVPMHACAVSIKCLPHYTLDLSTDIPHFTAIMDYSSSMKSDSRWENAKKALAYFLKCRTDVDMYVSLVICTRNVRVV